MFLLYFTLAQWFQPEHWYNSKTMSLDKELGTKIETVLHADSVKKAKRIISSKSGTSVLAAISFLESALPVPIITDPFLIAAILVDRSNATKLVMVATTASVIGAVLAYFTASLFLETILPLLSLDMVQQFESLIATNPSNAFMLTVFGAITPVPFTLAVWVVAAMKGGILTLMVASFLGRGLRYAVVGYSVYRFGDTAMSYAKRYVGFISIGLVVVIAIYLWFKM